MKFTGKEIAEAKKIKNNKNTPEAKEARKLFAKGEYPDYFYDEKHDMLYKKIIKGHYKHIV